MPKRRRFPKQVALPQDHGAWFFLASPLLIGLVAGGRLTVPSLYLVIAALAGFLMRQPLTILVKIAAGRRPPRERPAALRFLSLYAAIAALHVAGLVLRGHAELLLLALPALPVLAWHFALVARREERRQPLVELLAAGALALAAPAAMWIGRGAADPRGWWLWLLLWGQAASAILLVHMLLGWRERHVPDAVGARLAAGALPLALAAATLAAAAALGASGLLPRWLFIAHAVPLAASLAATLRPPARLRPRDIGWHQAAVSTGFTLLFAAAWLVEPGRAAVC